MTSKLFDRESKTIAGAALLIGGSAILSRVLGLLRDRALVARFGVGDALDAYYAAFQIPNFLFTLLILGTLSVAFIPVFAGYMAEGRRDEAWKMTDRILTIVAAGMGALCLLLAIAAGRLVPFIAPGFDAAKLEATVGLARILMLTTFLFAVSAVVSSVLNAQKRFLAVAMAPPLYNAAILFGILVLSKPFGIYGVAIGAVLGAILHLAIQVPPVLALGWRPRLSLDAGHPGVRQVGRLFLPRVFGIDISQLSQFIGTAIGTTFGSGAPAVFNLAMNIAAVPLGVFAIPFSIAAFPVLSDAAARGDREAFRSAFAATFRQVLFFLIPLSILAIVLRLHVVRIVIGARGLTWNETRLAAAAFALFVVTAALQGLAPLLARAFYALRNTLIPVLVSAVAVAVNVAATLALTAWLSTGKGAAVVHLWFGLFGVDDLRVLALAAAFSLASVAQVVLLFLILRKKYGRLGGAGIFRALGKFCLGGLAAAIAARLVVGNGAIALDVRPFISIFSEAALATLAGLGAYAAVLAVFRSEELSAVVAAVRGRFVRIIKPVGVSDAQEL